MTIIIPIISIITFLLFLNGLFVAAEFATVSVRRGRLSQLVEEGNQTAARLLPLFEEPRLLADYIATCQIGISASLLALGGYGYYALAPWLISTLTQWPFLSHTSASFISIALVLVCLTGLQIILGELLPKTIALQYSEQMAFATIGPIMALITIFRPFIGLTNRSGNLLLRQLSLPNLYEQLTAHTPQEIEDLITESHEGGLLDAEEQQLLRNAFRLRELTARQVMVPRTQIVAASVDSTVSSLMSLNLKEGFSRLPLYRDNIDNVVGFVHIKDLLRLTIQQQQPPTLVLREVTHVPETMPIADVWDTLNKSGQYLAIVFDEYGGTAGLLTFEDLLEEIFGEFQDEFDTDELPLVSSDEAGRIYLRGDLLVTDINEYLSLNLPDEEADTIGGLVFITLGGPPEVGIEVFLGEPEVAIRITALEGRRILEVSLELTDKLDGQIGEWEISQHD